MNVAVVVVTYNAFAWIDKCFGSLKLSSIPLSIYAIDNGSTDVTPSIIRQKYPYVDVSENRKNLGFGQANNIGIKKAYEAGADYILLLNQDAWVEEDTVEKLVNIHQKNPEYAITSPIHLNGTGLALDFGFANYIIPSKCPNLISDMMVSRIKDQLYETSFVNAAAWLLSKKCIETVGGFSPVFFHYGEDDNYVHRVFYHGFKVGIYPYAKIFHDREDRAKLDSKSEKEENKRILKLLYSNPLGEADIQNDLTKYKRLYIKKIIQLDFDSALYYKGLIDELKELDRYLPKALVKSKSIGKNFL